MQMSGANLITYHHRGDRKVGAEPISSHTDCGRGVSRPEPTIQADWGSHRVGRSGCRLQVAQRWSSSDHPKALVQL